MWSSYERDRFYPIIESHDLGINPLTFTPRPALQSNRLSVWLKLIHLLQGQEKMTSLSCLHQYGDSPDVQCYKWLLLCVLKYICMHSRFHVSALLSSAHASDRSNHSEFNWLVLSGQTAGTSLVIWVHGTDEAAPWAGAGGPSWKHVRGDGHKHRAGTKGEWRYRTRKQTCYQWKDNVWKRLKNAFDICWHFVQSSSHQYADNASDYFVNAK